MKKLLVLLAGCLVMASTFAQLTRQCGTMDALQQLQAADPNLAARMQQIESQTAAYVFKHRNLVTPQGGIVIPVVFHVVYNTNAQNISDAQVQAQVDQLNLDFARLNSDAANTPSPFDALAVNTGIQFCLAVQDPGGNATNGIERRKTTVNSFGTNDNIKYYSKGGLDAWPSDRYLNFWSGNLSNGLLGYAQFPGGPSATDGVVCLYSSIGSMLMPGTARPYDLGRTATHETGHWLNLRHIWGDDGGKCTGSDLVGDTPNQAGENYGCPSFPHTDNCSPSSPGVMFMNYMDYTDDGCMNMFSDGQASRMNALFSAGGVRASILSSSGCVPVSAPTCATPGGMTATGISSSAATLGWNTVSGAVGYSVRYRISGAATWNTTTTATNSLALSSLSASTTYEWQVQTTCASLSSSWSATSSLTTLSGGGGGGGCPDVYETNDASVTAATIVVNTDLAATLSPSGDEDWFKFSTTKPDTKVRVTLTNLPADYDVDLYQSNLSLLGTSRHRGTADETVIYNYRNPRNYLVRVYGYNGATSSTCYTVRVDVGSSNFRTSGTAGLSTKESVLSALELYPNPAGESVRLHFSCAGEGPVSIRFTDLVGQTILQQPGTAQAGDNDIPVGLRGMAGGLYIVEIQKDGLRSLQRLVVK